MTNNFEQAQKEAIEKSKLFPQRGFTIFETITKGNYIVKESNPIFFLGIICTYVDGKILTK